MSLLKKLTPINLLEEKEKFFADTSYNPQFIYEEDINESELYKYGLPKKDILEKAKKIVATAYAGGKTESDLVAENDPVISEQKVENMILAFLHAHGLENRFKVIWSASAISRASITHDTLKLRLNSEFRHYNTIGMIYHEIGTHALRRINYEQQPWFKKKKKYNLNNDYLPTEEGLASFHSLLPKSNKSAHTFALRYLTVEKALTTDFVGTWNFLEPYVDSKEKRWSLVVRLKRGIKDTGKLGAFTKDLVYFQGMIEVYDWLVNNSFSLEKMYLGKIAHEDIYKAIKLNPHFFPLLPIFYTQSTDEYKKSILSIGEKNFL